jgi:hypothetical protein
VFETVFGGRGVHGHAANRVFDSGGGIGKVIGHANGSALFVDETVSTLHLLIRIHLAPILLNPIPAV